MVIDEAFIFRGVTGVALGSAMAIWPRVLRLRAEQSRNRRVAELRSGDKEKYFEELRTLQAYTPPGSDFKWRLLGLLLIAAGIYMIVADFHGGLITVGR